ncbi:unnamed protein product [Brugia timori]|uniref:Microsomal triglyceride transfer protein large subunit n=1 Tax=Brugia timori TaxID=42155 RepID=A0A0R3QYI6_9BILA|nr:unnamed protein product [Brugia timori]
MKNCLRYLINDHLYVEATLENDKYQETFKTLIVRLCVEGEHAVIGKIKFLWPEQCLPNEITIDEKQTIVLRGIGNIARIPMRQAPFSRSNPQILSSVDLIKIMQPIKRSLYIGTSEDSVPSISVHTSLSSAHITEPFDSLAAKISNCLAQKDLSNIWNELSKLAKKTNVDLSDQLPVALSAQMQMALLKILRKCVSEKLFDRILTFIIHSRLITESKACCKFIELLASKSLIQQAVDLLRFSLMVDNRTYMMFLKMCSNEPVSKSSNLLSALLEKPVNSWGLRLTVSQELTEIEVTTLIERLILLGFDRKRDDLFDNILKLVAVLADSHSQRFVWDEKCHGAIRDAAYFAATMAVSLALWLCYYEKYIDFWLHSTLLIANVSCTTGRYVPSPGTTVGAKEKDSW